MSRCRRCDPVPEEVRATAALLERRWQLSILYAALLGRRRSRRTEVQTLRLELLGLVVLMVISYGWRFYVLQFQDHHTPYYRLATVWLPAYLDLFALGQG